MLSPLGILSKNVTVFKPTDRTNYVIAFKKPAGAEEVYRGTHLW
jgi:hypothetical protein